MKRSLFPKLNSQPFEVCEFYNQRNLTSTIRILYIKKLLKKKDREETSMS